MPYEVKVVHTVEYKVTVIDHDMPQEACEAAVQELIHSGELSRKEMETGVEIWRISGVRLT